MIISKKLLKLNRANEIKLNDFYRDARSVFDELSLKEKIKFSRIEKIILDTTSKIEKDSGWTFTPDGFSLYSDFYYDKDKHVIDFNVNRVRFTSFPESKTASNIELGFYLKYKNILNRLVKLLEDRQSILAAHLPSKENVISFKRIREDREWNETVLGDLDYIDSISINFMTEYGMQGINRLISLLNELTTSTDLMETYHNQFKEGMDTAYVRELYFWAISFTPRAQYTIDILDRQMQESKEFTPELREIK